MFHESTFSYIIAFFSFQFHIPPYASSLHIELYKLIDQFYIEIVYRNSSEENPLPLNIPMCGTKCSIEKFYEIYEKIIPTANFEEECEIPTSFDEFENGSKKMLQRMFPFIPIVVYFSNFF